MSCSIAAVAKGGALEATVAEELTFEAERSQPRQQWQDARVVVHVGRSQFEIEQRAVLVADREQLHTLDQSAAVDATYSGGRASGPTIPSHSPSLDQRRRALPFFTAIASARRWPTSTTSRLPRVTPV